MPESKFRFALYVFQVAISIAKIAVGVLYVEQCDLDISLYLMISGAIELGLSLLEISTLLVRLFTGRGFSDEVCYLIEVFIYGIHVCMYVALGIWGSTLVFGNYNEIGYNENAMPFCSEALVIFAFVILIIHWIMTAVILLWLLFWLFVCAMQCLCEEED
jgi:hypothetical protein